MADPASKWDNIYRQRALDSGSVAQVLGENHFLLPKQGWALDLACGLGANAIFLAERGLAVTAWDVSVVAIGKLQTYASQHGLQINGCQRNIDRQSFIAARFDVIVVSRFLDRALMDAIISALKPNGLLFYQTFTREKVFPSEGITLHGPHNPEYLLAENELLTLFSKLRVIFYRENGLCGDQRSGLRNEAQFIGQKLTHSG